MDLSLILYGIITYIWELFDSINDIRTEDRIDKYPLFLSFILSIFSLLFYSFIIFLCFNENYIISLSSWILIFIECSIIFSTKISFDIKHCDLDFTTNIMLGKKTRIFFNIIGVFLLLIISKNYFL